MADAVQLPLERISMEMVWQRLYSLSREAVQQVVEFTQALVRQGTSIDQIMEVLMLA